MQGFRAGLAIAAIGLCAFGAGPASAGLPKTRTHKIVPGVSIGGVKLGQSLRAARKAWGKGGDCKDESGATVCTYSRPSPFTGAEDHVSVADFVVRDGAVITIDLFANYHDAAGRHAAIKPLARFKTSKHIGLGSTEQDLHAAYPTASEDQHHSGVVLQAAHGTAHTNFGVLDGEVAAITIMNQ